MCPVTENDLEEKGLQRMSDGVCSRLVALLPESILLPTSVEFAFPAADAVRAETKVCRRIVMITRDISVKTETIRSGVLARTPWAFGNALSKGRPELVRVEHDQPNQLTGKHRACSYP